MQNKDPNEKLKLHQMKITGFPKFFLNHRTKFYSFIYAQCMSQVVKGWQCSQVNSAAGNFDFSRYFLLSYKSQLKFCLAWPTQGIQRKYGIIFLLAPATWITESSRRTRETYNHFIISSVARTVVNRVALALCISAGISVPVPQDNYSSVARCALGHKESVRTCVTQQLSTPQSTKTGSRNCAFIVQS